MILYILDMNQFERSEYCKELPKHKKHHAAGQYLLRLALGEEAYEQAVFVKGEHGKPHITGHPIHYNISHSGQYVVLVVADSEVGVDVQEKKGRRLSAMAKRFFSEEEYQQLTMCADRKEKVESAEYAFVTCDEAERKRLLLTTCDSTEETRQTLSTYRKNVEEASIEATKDYGEAQSDLFFHIWCRKEAYGKYLGLGLLGEVLKTNVLEGVEGCYFQEYSKLEGYQISICCGKEEEIEEVISVFEGL